MFSDLEVLFLPSFGHFPGIKRARGNVALNSGTLLVFVSGDRQSLLEFFTNLS